MNTGGSHQKKVEWILGGKHQKLDIHTREDCIVSVDPCREMESSTRLLSWILRSTVERTNTHRALKMQAAFKRLIWVTIQKP